MAPKFGELHMIFGKLFRRKNPDEEARAKAEAERLSKLLNSDDNQPKPGVDPLGEKIPAEPANVQRDPGPGIEVKLPVDPNAKH